MKKKIIALILVIPLIFMFTIFSVSKVASINIPISVCGISIANKSDGHLSFDIANYNGNFKLDVTIKPANAHNKKYSVISENEEVATFDSNKNLVLHDIGETKITVQSNDGAFVDTLKIFVLSTEVLDYDIEMASESKSIELIGEFNSYTANIPTGLYFFNTKIYPDTIINYNRVWSSSNSDIVEIDSLTGEMVARASGEAVIKCNVDNKITKSILLKVNQKETESGITIEGQDYYVASVADSANGFSCIVEAVAPNLIENTNIASSKLTKLEALGDNIWSLDVAFNDGIDRTDQINIYLVNADNPNQYKLTISFDESIIQVYSDATKKLVEGETYIARGDTEVKFIAKFNPYVSDVVQEWEINTDDNINYNVDNGILTIMPTELGECTLKVSVKDNKNITIKSFIFDVKIVNSYTNFVFISDKDYGIGKEYAVGNQKIENENYINYKSNVDIRLENGLEVIGYDVNDISFSSNKSTIAIIRKINGKALLDIFSTGRVIITAKWANGNKFGKNITKSFSFYCVKDGVTVASEEDLFKATSDGKKIVLNGDIMLGRPNMTKAEVQSYNDKTILTTADWTYYKNMQKNQPSVHYLVEFKNDVFGNGYDINADYLTQAKDSTGKYFLWRDGPLNFVDMQGYASVKGQDNIVFLIRCNNIIINNVNLLGCSNESLKGDNQQMDLTKLNNTGTTLEIMSSCTVTNCRITNGCNCVRVYGKQLGENVLPIVNSAFDVNVGNERITPSIESCILSQAREFILKVGTNRALCSTEDNLERTLNNSHGLPYNMPKNDNTNLNNTEFYNSYVLTDLKIKDCNFKNSGLFSIGVETHFAGPFLNASVKGDEEFCTYLANAGIDLSADAINEKLSQYGWDNLAGTSFPAILRLEGKVNICDWKKLENIDSSTLINVSGKESGNGGVNSIFKMLQLNLDNMIEKATLNVPSASKLIDNVNGEKYVHGGIVFYGGGRNYSEVDMSGLTSEILNEYLINISGMAVLSNQDELHFTEEQIQTLTTQGKLIPAAAGTQDFRFFMYNSDSVFNLKYQNNNADELPIPTCI